MEPNDPATADAFLEVIRTLRAQLDAQIRAVAEASERHAREREVSAREIKRLIAMVEGLTRQLDELLRDRADEKRAELARIRDEARAAAAAATAAAGPSPVVPPLDSETPAPAVEPSESPGGESDKPPPSTSNRHAHGRAPKPPGVARDVHVLRPGTCQKCGGHDLRDGRPMEPIEEWDFIRAHLRIRHTVRVGCTCEDCGTETPAPPAPPMPFDRAACTFSLMAWLCFSRCGLFLPLDRLMRDFEAQGVPLPSATLTRWWQRGTDLLLPIASAVRMSLLADMHIRTDGTGLQVVFPRVKGKPKNGDPRPGPTDEKGYLPSRDPLNGQILVFGNDDHAVYVFTPTREGRHALDFLTVGHDVNGQPILWRGTITADALSAQDCLFTDGTRVETGCNGHGLRKFRDEADKAPLLASRAMAFIGQIYDVEDAAKAKDLQGAALLAHREEHSRPVVDRFRAFLDQHITDLLPTNPVRKAMQYYLNHWAALTHFLLDPDVPLDNNWSERALRIVALLRNNSLYAGGEDGAARVCTMFTLIHTCRLHGLDPYEYLVWALCRVVPHPDNRRFAPVDLTPAAYKAFLAEARKAS
jgi:transposase